MTKRNVKRLKHISNGQNKEMTKILKMSYLLLDELPWWKLQIKSTVKINWIDNIWKPKRQARVEVYDNCIAFDIRTRYEKEKRFINVDWNDEEIIERIKMTKRKTINPLWAVSFVLGLWYKFVEDKFYDEEIETIEENDWFQQYEIQWAIQKSLF